MLIWYIFIFILGTIVGSFLNVVILRLKNKKSIFKKPSHCPFCKKKLKWYELIPIISFVLQKGRCRKCKKKISWQYPLVELATGFSFMLILNFPALGGPALGWQFSNVITLLFWLLISCFLIIIFVYDLKYYLVPDKIIYPAILVAGIWQLVSGIFIRNTSYEILNTFLAAIIGGAFFLVIVLISKGHWMGMGDVKIGILMGLLLGLPHLFTALFLAFLIGGVVSIILLALKRKTPKSEIPLGPFLAGATFVTLLWGGILLNWYLNLLI